MAVNDRFRLSQACRDSGTCVKNTVSLFFKVVDENVITTLLHRCVSNDYV